MDCGAFVTLLEAAAGKTAKVMGKPSETFFKIALESLQVSPNEAVVVGGRHHLRHSRCGKNEDAEYPCENWEV